MFVVAPNETEPAIFRKQDEGATWQSDPAWPKNIRDISTTAENPDMVVCASLTRIFASTNQGQTWIALPEIPGGRGSR